MKNILELNQNINSDNQKVGLLDNDGTTITIRYQYTKYFKSIMRKSVFILIILVTTTFTSCKSSSASLQRATATSIEKTISSDCKQCNEKCIKCFLGCQEK